MPSIEEMTIKGKIGCRIARMSEDKINKQKGHNTKRIESMNAKMKPPL